MNRKWMPVTAGVIDIIHGAAGILVGFLLIFVTQSLSDFFGAPPWYSYLLMLVIILAGALAITGGVCALKRKDWPLALAGSIASFFLTVWSLEYWTNIGTYGLDIDTLYGFAGVPALFAIVLTALSRGQFRKKNTTG
jgi:hypothetical protein